VVGLVTVRVTAIGAGLEVCLAKQPTGDAYSGPEAQARPARLLAGEPRLPAVPHLRSWRLPVGARLARPAVVEEPECTTVSSPRAAAEIDRGTNPTVEFRGSGRRGEPRSGR
jgi:N-methylhydantoinase A/oxoprolinase/acetone carboxylase beta subunit